MVVHWSSGIAAGHVPVGVRGAVTTPLPPSGVANVTPREATSQTSSSFSEFYRTHVTYVWKTACRLGVTAADVEDVVQETFLTAHRLGVVAEMQATERAWLFGIVYNVVQHHRRSHRRRTARTEGGMNLDVFPGPSADAPDRGAETSEAVRILETILDTLEPEKRAVLVLAELEEKSLSEIAKILAINVNTAASRLRLAREDVEAAIARHRARDGWRYK